MVVGIINNGTGIIRIHVTGIVENMRNEEMCAMVMLVKFVGDGNDDSFIVDDDDGDVLTLLLKHNLVIKFLW